MSDRESIPTPADDVIDKIHEIQEEIFDREDQIDDLVDASQDHDAVLDAVEEGKMHRRRLHLKRLRADWNRMVERSREATAANDFELAAALIHFIGDILISQSDGADGEWIEELKAYIEENRALVN